MGALTLAAISVVMGSIVDTMRYADVSNEAVHVFLDRLEQGFDAVLIGDARDIMLELVQVLRLGVPCND